MSAYIIRRVLQSLVVLAIVTIIVFVAMRLLPGDPIRMLVTQSDSAEMSEAQITLLRHQYGLDKPMPVQYWDWITGIVLHGNLGTSIMNKSPVSIEIMRRLPITLHLALTAYIIGILIGIPVGIIAAVKRGKPIDTFVTTFSNLGITMPVFWFGIMLIYVFGVYLKWLPVMGYTSPFTDFWLGARQMVMPIMCMVFFPIASMSRQTRSSMLEVLRQDYIRTAWSKGLKHRTIIIRHALKNGLIPVVTLSGMGLALILSGSVMVETVFNIPGMGRLAVTSVTNQDYPYVQGIILIVSANIMFINLLVDLSYGWLDPRIRFG